MEDIAPRFRCTACQRGVLNRSVPRCLYCGAGLPDEARLGPEAIAQRDAGLARRKAEQAHLALVASVYPPEHGTWIEGIAAGATIAGLIGDLPS